jgi:lysophospholipase L1-like esterase
MSSTHRDDSLMSRFEREGVRHYGAADAVKAVAIVAVLLVLFSGGSVRHAAAEIDPGIGHDIVSAVGEPTRWVADRLPLQSAQSELTSGLSPDTELAGAGFDDTTAGAATAGGARGGVPPVTPEAFDPAAIGAEAPAKQELGTLLVTGDSLSTPLDNELAQRLAPEGVNVIRDPHLATGISNSDLVDWAKLSSGQVASESPDAVVVFIGANEGYSMPGPDGQDVECCGPDYAAVYANRVRQVMDTYRQDGAAKVYWLTVMTPRDPDAQRVIKMVNAAIDVAAEPWRSQVRVVDMVSVFTPGDRYTDSIDIDGEPTIVRESDGIHLNEAGASHAADIVLGRIDEDFTH